MSIENLYQQAQVFLDASTDGRPLTVTSTGQLKTVGFGNRAVASIRGLISSDSERQAQAVEHNRQIVRALISAVEEAISPSCPDEIAELSRAVELLNSSFDAGQLPVAQTFVSLLRRAERKRSVSVRPSHLAMTSPI